MNVTRTVFSIVLLASFLASAQMESAAPPVEPLPETEAQTPGEVPAAPVPQAPQRGDEVHLQSGAVLKNLQVLRRSPRGYEVMVVPEVTFFIPRKQVIKIEYDDFEPSKDRLMPETPEEKKATLFGAKIKPETFEKLNKPLPESCLKSDNEDLVDVMALISSQTGVKIEVSGLVKNLPPADRLWEYTLDPGTTLTNFLLADLPQRFENLAIVYKYDTLLIQTREEAAEHEKKEAETESVPAPVKPE